MVSVSLTVSEIKRHISSITRGGDVVGLNPSIRIYRYSKGQFFDRHCRFLSCNI